MVAKYKVFKLMSIDLMLGVLIGLILGLIGAFMYLKFKGDNAASIEQLKEEHANYRKQVDDHFVNTATLFKGLTD